MVSRGIGDFMRRDWDAVRQLKDAYWAARLERLGAAEGFRVSEALRRQARLLDPTWPGPAQRTEDLEAHARLSARLRRADAARRA